MLLWICHALESIILCITVNNCSPLGGTDLSVISSSEQFGEVSVIGEPKGC